MSTDATRTRILDATRVALARYGPRKIALTDIARLAEISRPTLYRYFPSKEALLAALAEYEHTRFEQGMAESVRGLEGDAQIDAALRFVVDYQTNDPIRHLVPVEPGFVLEQVSAALGVTGGRMQRLFADRAAQTGADPDELADIADIIVRTSLSHFLIPAHDPEQLLRELRAIAGIVPAVAPKG